MSLLRRALLCCVLSAFAVCGHSQPSGSIDHLVRTYSSPDTSMLLGRWEYAGDSFVFMGKQGPTPSIEQVERLMNGMGIRKGNFDVVFHDSGKCTFRVGQKEFNVAYSIKPETREFKATRSHISMKGFIFKDGERMSLVFSRLNLFILLRVFCSEEERKNIKPVGELLDSTPGLTVGIEFAHE